MEWRSFKLGEIGEFRNGVNFSADKMGKGIPLINVKDVTKGYRIIPGTLEEVDLTFKLGSDNYALMGDIFFVRSSVKRLGAGAVGMLRNNDLPAIHCGFVIRFRLITDEVHPEFLLYQLLSEHKREQVRNLSAGATIFNISQGALKDLDLDIPPLTIQHRIASILSSYDDLIEVNMRRIKLLEDAAVCEYRMLMEDGQEEIEIRHLVKWVKGKKPKDISQLQLDGYLPYLVFDTIEGNAVTFAHTEKVPIASTHDVLMCMDGARSGVVFRGIDGVLGSTFATLKLEQLAHSEYIYQFLSTNLEYIVQGNVGAAIPHANREYINSMKIAIPDQVSLDDYNHKVGPLVSLISNLKAQNTHLRQARDILLPKLMSGEIELVENTNASKLMDITTIETMSAEGQVPDSNPMREDMFQKQFSVL